LCLGVTMTPLTPVPCLEPVTVVEAARRLQKAPGTIYSWVTRYGARRLGAVNGTMYYDFYDLALIERQIRRGLPVNER
jgi:transposase-like protein